MENEVLYRTIGEGDARLTVKAEYPRSDALPHLSEFWQRMAENYCTGIERMYAKDPVRGSAVLFWKTEWEEEERISLRFTVIRYREEVPVTYREFGQLVQCREDRLLSPLACGIRAEQSFVQNRDGYAVLVNTFSNPNRMPVRRSALPSCVKTERAGLRRRFPRFPVWNLPWRAVRHLHREQ